MQKVPADTKIRVGGQLVSGLADMKLRTCGHRIFRIRLTVVDEQAGSLPAVRSWLMIKFHRRRRDPLALSLSRKPRDVTASSCRITACRDPRRRRHRHSRTWSRTATRARLSEDLSVPRNRMGPVHASGSDLAARISQLRRIPLVAPHPPMNQTIRLPSSGSHPRPHSATLVPSLPCRYRTWTCSRATDTSTCIACRRGLAWSRSCIQTVDPWPSGSIALSSASSAYPRTARQKPTSTVSGCAAMASWTSCARARSATAPCRRATAETARASSTCSGSSCQISRVNRTVSWSSAMVKHTRAFGPGTCATASASRTASRVTTPGTPPSLRRATTGGVDACDGCVERLVELFVGLLAAQILS